MNIWAFVGKKNKESVFGSATKTRLWKWILKQVVEKKNESVSGSATKTRLWKWILELVDKKKKESVSGSATKTRLWKWILKQVEEKKQESTLIKGRISDRIAGRISDRISEYRQSLFFKKQVPQDFYDREMFGKVILGTGKSAERLSKIRKILEKHTS